MSVVKKSLLFRPLASSNGVRKPTPNKSALSASQAYLWSIRPDTENSGKKFRLKWPETLSASHRWYEGEPVREMGGGVGGGGAIVDGFRRWFQRRSSRFNHNNNNNNDNNKYTDKIQNTRNDQVLLSDDGVDSTSEEVGQHQEDRVRLKLIKVPKRTNHRLTSMDSHRKVCSHTTPTTLSLCKSFVRVVG